MAAPGTKEVILDSLLKTTRHSGTLREFVYDLNMPLLLNPPESPLACRETQEEFETINASFSAQIHALFEALHESEGRTTSTDGGTLIDVDGLQLAIRIINQSFDIYPSCLHRHFHSRRLSLRHEDGDRQATSLPQLSRVTVLRLFPARDYAHQLWECSARLTPHTTAACSSLPEAAKA